MKNSALGMVRQWQERFYEERYSQSLLDTNPDFVKLADSYGVKGMKVEHEADVDAAIEEMLAYDGPILVDFRIIKDRKSTRLNSSHVSISYAVFCLKKKIDANT